MSDKQELNMEEMGQVAGGWTFHSEHGRNGPGGRRLDVPFQWKIPHMARRV